VTDAGYDAADLGSPATSKKSQSLETQRNFFELLSKVQKITAIAYL